jgi:hypothetical protein
MAALSLVNRDYAATLATAEKSDCLCPKIGFSDLLTRGKSPKVSVLEAESSRPRHDNTKCSLDGPDFCKSQDFPGVKACQTINEPVHP